MNKEELSERNEQRFGMKPTAEKAKTPIRATTSAKRKMQILQAREELKSQQGQQPAGTSQKRVKGGSGQSAWKGTQSHLDANRVASATPQYTEQVLEQQRQAKLAETPAMQFNRGAGENDAFGWADMREGDILNWRPEKQGLFAKGMDWFTGAPYMHTGIWANGQSAEMLGRKGQRGFNLRPVREAQADLFDNYTVDVYRLREDAVKDADKVARIAAQEALIEGSSKTGYSFGNLGLATLKAATRVDLGQYTKDKATRASICSELVHRAYRRAGVNLTGGYSATTSPSDLGRSPMLTKVGNIRREDII